MYLCRNIEKYIYKLCTIYVCRHIGGYKNTDQREIKCTKHK